MADFGRTQVDYEGSPVQPVAPVQNNVAATAVQGVSSIVSTVGQLFAGAAANKISNVKINAKADFESQLADVANAYRQGAYKTLDQAQAAWGQVYSKAVAANPTLLPEYSESATRLAGAMGIGKVISEGTREDQLYAKKEEEANTAGHIKSWMTPDQRKAAVNSYVEFQATADKMKRDKEALEFEASRVSLDKSKLELIRARRTEVSINNLSTLANNYNPKFQSDMQDVIEQVKAGKLDQKSAYLAIQQHWSVVDSTLRSVGKDAGGDYIANLVKPIADMKALAEELVSGKIDQDMFERNMQVATNLQQTMLMQDPETVQLLAASKLFPNSELLLQTQINSAVMRYMNGSKPVDLFEDTETGKKNVDTLFNVFKGNMNKLANGTAINPEGTQAELNTQVTRVLKGITAYSAAVDSPAEYNKVTDFLASPEFGAYAKKSGGVPIEVASEAKATLSQTYEEAVLKSVKNAYEKASVGLVTSVDVGGMGTYNKVDASGSKTATSVIEPVFSGSGVMFKLREGVEASPSAVNKVKELNKTAAPLLNKLVRMSAHLNGDTNYKKAFDDNYVAIFGVDQPSQPKK